MARIWERVRGKFQRFALTLPIMLAVLGPGIITGNVDNDAGGITTYSVIGARFGYSMLWMLLLITFTLAMIQEMCARMGVVTGKGLADLIREPFHRHSSGCIFSLASGRQGVISRRGEGSARVLCPVLDLCHQCFHGTSQLGGRCQVYCRSDVSDEPRVHLAVHRYDRNHDCTLDAVLPAVFGRGEGNRSEAVSL